MSNPSLCALLSKWLGTEAWIRNVDLLTGLREYAEDSDLQQEWMMVHYRLHICAFPWEPKLYYVAALCLFTYFDGVG